MDRKISILIVDDDEDDVFIFLKAIKESFSNFSYHVSENGREAIDYLENEPDQLPDVIFLDLNMPVMDGKKCLVELKGHKIWSSIPVVIYTTSNRGRDKLKLTKLNADYFLTKRKSYSEIKYSLTTIINTVVDKR